MSYILRPVCAGLLYLFALNAIQAQFVFSYDGPDTLFVGADCTVPLNWGHPETPDVFPTLPGQVIVSWKIYSISGGYMIDDPVPAGQTVTIFYEVRDNMGHISLFGFNLPVVDRLAPVFDPASLPDDVTVSCAGEVPVADITYSDNCSDPNEIQLIYQDGGNAPICIGGVVNRSWTITDGAGNSAVFVQHITVVTDTTAPVITVIPENGMAQCGNADDAYTAWLEAQRTNFAAEDIGCGISSLTDNAPPVSALLGFCGDLEVAFFATDSCNNSTSVIAVFSVTNDEAPEITMQAIDASGACTTTSPASAFVQWIDSHGGAQASDDCSLISWTTDPANPSLEGVCNTALEVTFIANDGCGNTASTTASFFVQDTTPPAFASQAQNKVINCSSTDWVTALGTWLLNAGNTSATDICTDEDSLIVRFLLNGNPLDSAAVVAAMMDSITDGTCVDGVVINGLIQNNVLGMITLGFEVSDRCGNASTSQAIFAVIDAVGPQFVTPPGDSILTCAGGDVEALFTEWYETAGFAHATDDCGSIYFTSAPTYEDALAGLMDGLDSICTSGVSVEVAFTVHDYCGNTNPEPHSATFGISGGTGPQILTMPTDLLYDCSGNAYQTLQGWLDTLGGAEVQQGCSQVDWTFSWMSGGMLFNGTPGVGPYPEPGSLDCATGLGVTFTAADLCGNAASASATFMINDTVAPVITVDSLITISCDSLQNLVLDVSDNCTSSPQINFIDVTMGGDTTSCLSGTIIRTWMVTDDCGNLSTAVQTIETEDLESPTFTAPGDTILYCTNGSMPDAGMPGMIIDNCDADPAVTYRDVISGNGCDQTVVRTWIVTDACGNSTTAAQNISLVDTLAPALEEIPSDLALECTDPVAMTASLNAWLNALGGATITDFCGDVTAFIAMQGSYQIDDPSTWPGEVPVLPGLTCGADTLGSVYVDLVFADACGNAGMQGLRIMVLDHQPPVVIDCPADTVIQLDAGLCEQEVKLTVPMGFDVCQADLDTTEISAMMPVASVSPGDSSVPVGAIELTLQTSGIPGVVYAPVVLRIDLQNVDADGAGEYFRVFGDDGSELGVTSLTPEECGTGITEFNISEAVFDDWASDGQVRIELRPNDAVAGDTTINDICMDGIVIATMRVLSGTPDSVAMHYRLDTLTPVQVDPLSEIGLHLSVGLHRLTWIATDCAGNTGTCTTQIRVMDHEPPMITCPGDIQMILQDPETCLEHIVLPLPEVSDSCGIDLENSSVSISGDTIIQALIFGTADAIEIVLPAGMFLAEYLISDISGNTSTCTVSIGISDGVRPEAVCRAATVLVPPSGVTPGILDPALLDGGSTDNCRIDSMRVVPSEFLCDSAGTIQPVMLIVYDRSGNADTCFTEVTVEVEPLMPTYESGICETDTLRLFANVPAAPGNPYTFKWTGPNGFTSLDENPVIPDADASASGLYLVEVTGAGDCMSSGSVEVVAGVMATVELSVAQSEVCEGDTVVLSASVFNLAVIYHWYRGVAPGGLLIGSTSEPVFEDTPPVTGSYPYYVVVESPNCTLPPSNQVSVQVSTMPEASVNPAFVQVCAGETVELGTPMTGQGITYEWTGPDSFYSTDQNPVINEILVGQAGTYRLIVFRNGCASQPAFVDVAVAPRPEQPVIAGDSVYCTGSDLTLTAGQVTMADQYIWTNPQMQGIPTQTNTLTLSNIMPSMSGGWTVVAMLGDCPSLVSDTFFIEITDGLPVEASNSGPFCDGSQDSIVLLVDILPDVNYMWSGPNGFMSNEANPVLVGVEGEYTVTVTASNGCTGVASTIVTAEDAPTITSLSNTSGSCADSLQNLAFAFTVFPADNGAYTYHWTGPNGFVSDEQDPLIPYLNAGLNGTYTLVVSLGSCDSEPMSTEVSVMDAPDRPTLDGALMYCSGEQIVLTASAFPGDSVLYLWHTPVGDFEFWNDSILVLDDVSGLYTGSYSVIVNIDGCDSPESAPLQILVSQVIQEPVITGPSMVCSGDTIFLSGPSVMDGVYSWTGPNGFIASGQNPMIPDADSLDAGAYFLVIQVGDCESDTSDALNVFVLELPEIPEVLDVSGSVCLSNPDPLELCLLADSMTPGATYTWSVSGNVIAAADGSCVTITDFSHFSAGQNMIEVTAELNGCASAQAGTVEIEMDVFPVVLADAGPDLDYCLDDAVMMNAQTPDVGSGYWSSPDPGVVFENILDPFTRVEGLQEGGNVLIWTLDFESCTGYASDTVIVSVESTPIAVPDTIEVPFGQTIDFNVLLNDSPGAAFILRILQIGPLRGNYLDKGQGVITYDPNIGFVGMDRMFYELCSQICPDQCTTAEVILKVGDENDCFIPSIFTPNGDGTNDRLIVPCLETDLYPDNHLLVFNEWGDAVFEAEPYDNSWDGTRNGKDLPVATYFYILDFGDGRPVQSGFLILDR